VFALGIGGVLTCCDAGDGRVIWRKVFKEGEIDSREFFCGNSSSPLVDQGRLIAYRGDDSKGILGAYDVKTGDEIWSWSGDNPGYSSPIVIDVGGSKHVVTLSQTKVIGLDADSGLLLWEIPFVSQWKENVPTPVYSAPDGASRNAGLLVYSGTKRGVTAVRLDRDPESGSWAPVTVWETGEVSLYMSTPLVGDGFLFGLSQLRKGQIFCLDLASGEVAWTSKGRHGDNASFVLVGDKILSLTTEGSLIVFPRSPEGFEAIRTYGVSETPTWATPAPVDQGLLIKNQDELMLVSLKG
jgi:outer membrane protein assembly factor BamB